MFREDTEERRGKADDEAGEPEGVDGGDAGRYLKFRGVWERLCSLVEEGL